MAKKQMLFKTKGMNRDLSVSSFNPEFAFENMNLRLSTNDGNTLLSWVNEKGPKEITLEGETTIEGIAIGTAVLNEKLIIFTTETIKEPTSTESTPDRIYVLKYSDAKKSQMKVVKKYKGKLNFSAQNPLETLVSYEADFIQKVYWVDGRNQPRLINIYGDATIADKGEEGIDHQFDFVPTFKNPTEVTIKKNSSSIGIFAPGVIQYCFTYFNKYGQQTNIVWVSDLQYISHSDRGASPEDKVSTSFTIDIKGLDTNFKYIRLYSIQRTSLNADVFAKRLDDIPITRSAVSYVDNGTTGSSMDPYELLYVGGKDIIAQTMKDKDSTLFMGNITEKNILVNDLKTYFRNHKPTITYTADKKINLNPDERSKAVYLYKNQLKNSMRKIATFKGGEWYRFGFQIQKKTGEWLEPIWIGDKQNDKYPSGSVGSSTVNLVQASATITLPNNFDLSLYQSIRPVIVYPTIADRTVLCQGVLNPTVFNVPDRRDHTPDVQASWFFRPYMVNTQEDSALEIPEKAVIVGESVVIEDFETVDVSPNAAFVSTGELMDAYVLLAEIDDENTSIDILERGYLNLHVSGWTHYHNDELDESRKDITRPLDSNGPAYFDIGAIHMGRNLYAFLKSTPWEEEFEGKEWEANRTYGYIRYNRSQKYTDNLKNIRSNATPFQIYNNMYTYGHHKCYYSKLKDSNPDSFEFKFYVQFEGEFTLYTVTFNSIGEDYVIIANNTDGKGLSFKHFDSLYCQSDVYQRHAEKDYDPTDAARKIEIQGSVNSFRNPYGEITTSGTGSTTSNQNGNFGGATNIIVSSGRRAPAVPSGTRGVVSDTVTVNGRVGFADNSQFFVDQSIITLNSPDIEFDTEVQSYDTENLSLHIVGVIPITANTSAHSITTSTNSGGSSLDSEEEDTGTRPDFAISLADGSHVMVYKGYGKGNGKELSFNVTHLNIDSYAGNRLVSDYLWNDNGSMKKNEDYFQDADIWLVSPWNRSGSLNNDPRGAGEASSVLDTKKMSHLLFSANTEYISGAISPASQLDNIDTQICLTENAQVMNYRLKQQTSRTSSINYYPNVDEVITPLDYTVIGQHTYSGYYGQGVSSPKVSDPVLMKYKSTSHAVIALCGNSDKAYILPGTDYSHGAAKTAWGDTIGYTSMNPPGIKSEYNYLWLGELRKTGINESNVFGGNTEEAILGNKWVVCGESKDISSTNNLVWNEGDTYYQRYDTLKTYPFTFEDPNQIVEILSFMCETHINIDGRYDRNRGQINNNNMHPKNFNLLNPVYSQQNNYFTYRQLDTKDVSKLTYPNQISFSKTKTSGADIDLWTNITLASTLELDGDKGEITSLQRFNDQLIAFQDLGVSQILYNENTQISTTAGVPIEIANSGKVQGKRYLSSAIGCSNKWGIINTPSGIYFMDSNDKGIYVFNGQLQNLSVPKGFNTWCKQNIPAGNVKWNPADFNTFTGFYDKLNQDVLWVNKEAALAYSEKLRAFTSFYDYGNTPFFNNVEDTGVWIKNSETTEGSPVAQLWKHQAGEYSRFFGENKPYWMTLVGNPEPTVDKIFTNLEFRACVTGEGEYSEKEVSEGGETKTVKTFEKAYLPFDYLETWDEYQRGIANIDIRNGHDAFKHHLRTNDASLKRKFRIWRCDIPRDNAEIDEEYEAPLGIARFKKHPVDRMRNPWLYLKLMKNAAKDEELDGETIKHSLPKAEIHDVVMTYY